MSLRNRISFPFYPVFIHGTRAVVHARTLNTRKGYGAHAGKLVRLAWGRRNRNGPRRESQHRSGRLRGEKHATALGWKRETCVSCAHALTQ